MSYHYLNAYVFMDYHYFEYTGDSLVDQYPRMLVHIVGFKFIIVGIGGDERFVNLSI